MKPNGFGLDLKYTCKCGTDNWLSLAEAKQLSRIVCIYCENVIKIDKISSATVKVNFVDGKSQPIKVDSIVRQAAQLLINQGYGREEINRFVKNKSYQSVTDLVKDFLTHYEQARITT